MFNSETSPRTRRRRKVKEVQRILARIRNRRLRISNILNREPPPAHISTESPQSECSYASLTTATFIENEQTLDQLDNNLDSLSRETKTFHALTESLETKPIQIDQALRGWTLQYNIKHSALRNLLQILNQYKFSSNLPLDPRTLMHTPDSVKTTELSGGSYIYFGIKQTLIQRILCGVHPDTQFKSRIFHRLKASVLNPLITISVGVDGIPLTRSTNKQFWPVLGVVDQSLNSDPFVIALYYGESKPANLDFLNDFINECQLLENEGVLADQLYSFRISKILADAPARSFIKGCKSHNSYHGCEKCHEEGEWSGRVIYPNVEFIPRSDESFLLKSDEAHHVASTSLSKLRIGLVSQVPLDYLHLVCLGVTRKLFRQWVKGRLPHRIQSRCTISIGERLQKMRKEFPSEFQRKPRPLIQIDHYKGTEFRCLLLYTGVSALKGIISQKEYKLFLLFHTAIFILLSPRADQIEWNFVARSLLKKFVRKCINLYGHEFAVYNLHGLLHLHEDALNFGTLDNASTFAFENFMQKIKHYIHSHNFHLEQVAKRILEGQALEFDATKNSKRIQKNVCVLSCKKGDNCFMLKSNIIVVLCKVAVLEPEIKYFCNVFQNFSAVKEYPIDSAKLGIYEVQNVYVSMNMAIEQSDILYKCMKLPFKSGHICLPILHSIN